MTHCFHPRWKDYSGWFPCTTTNWMASLQMRWDWEKRFRRSVLSRTWLKRRRRMDPFLSLCHFRKSCYEKKRYMFTNHVKSIVQLLTGHWNLKSGLLQWPRLFTKAFLKFANQSKSSRFDMVDSKCYWQHLTTSSKIDLPCQRSSGLIWLWMKDIAWKTPIPSWHQCFDSTIPLVIDLFLPAHHCKTTFQSYGHCSILSCHAFSTASRALRSGSIPLFPTKVCKTRLNWMKKSNCLSLNDYTR